MLNRRNVLIALSAFALSAGVASIVQAQAKPDANGTWKWTQAGRGGGGGQRGGGAGAPGGGAPGGGAAPGGAPARGPASQPGAAGAPAGGPPGGGAGRGPGGGGGRGGAPIEISATLKQDGEKLTGDVLGMTPADPAAKSAVSEGSVKADGSVSFKVVTSQAFGGGDPIQITRTYAGKLEGDKITGTMTVEFPAGGFGGPGGAPGAAPGGAPGAGRGPASQPGAAGAPAGGAGPGGGAGRGPGGGGGRGAGPQEWIATRQK